MNNALGIFGAMRSITIIESILRMLSYIAFISVAFKGIQALNIYINNNSK